MMALTHLAIGLLLAIPAIIFFPDQYSLALFLSAAIGSIFPDIDLYVGSKHRKSLHFPIIGTVFGAVLLISSLIYFNPISVFVGLFLFSGGIHSLSDIFGAGVEFKPWRMTSQEAVYNHVQQKWHAPRYYIPYDGSPKDFAVMFIAVGIGFFEYSSRFFWYETFAISILLIAGVYTIFRKKFPILEKWLYRNVPVLRNVLNYEPGDEDNSARKS